MWTLLVLCSVIAAHGVRGEVSEGNPEAKWMTPGPEATETAFSVADESPVTGAACGGYLSGSSGTFYSPNYPHSYPSYAHCTWYIRPGSPIVQLRFSDVNIEAHSSCSYDAVYVYDNYSVGAHLLGKVCGTRSVTFNSTGPYLTVRFVSDSIVNYTGFRADYSVVGSCRYNCGSFVGGCSCTSSCGYYGNCCPDYEDYCQPMTSEPPLSESAATAQPSCRYNCGWDLGSCSCTSHCEYYGNCCHDYNAYCQSSTAEPFTPTTAQPSCRYNCGWDLGSCSCTSHCEYYGNCCHDYNAYCQSSTAEPFTPTTAQPSCRYNCGWDLGSCSCTSNCEYYGNCCHDYYSYCSLTTAAPCGKSLSGSGTFTSPNHPNHYHDNTYCVWQLRAAYDQRISLTVTYLQLENCCSCDYIAVYDGPSVHSQYLGKVCSNNLTTLYSTSNYMTVLFHTDGSVVGRGFKAEFTSVLPQSTGRVDCSSENMNIVIKRSYLNSLGYDGHSLYLDDPSCRPQVYRHEVVFHFPINACGNVRKFENSTIVYTNTLRAYASSSGEITRQSQFKMNVGCRMAPDSVSQIMYVVEHQGNSSITGTGRFNTSMDFYTSSSFYNQVTEVPYKVTLNQNLYVQVDQIRRDNALVLFLDTCVASPLAHDFHTRPYYLVRNGCARDSTYYAYVSGTNPYARFTFKVFQFLRATESVYIQCKVLICPASDYNSRCRRGCNRRMTRDLGSEHDSQTLVLGPIQLEGPEEKEEGTHEQDKD